MSFITSLIFTLISLIVFLNSKGISNERNRLVVQGLALLVGVFSAFSSITKVLTIIPAGNIGVIDTFGKVGDRPLDPGVHFINPFARVVNFSTRLNNVQEDVESTSQEGLGFNIHVSLQYRIDPQKAPEVYKTIGKDPTGIIIPRFRSIVREITADYPAEAIYSTKRQEVANKLRDRMTQQLAPLGFVAEETLLREIKIPEKIQAAIQEKLKADQQNQQMTFTLQKERKEAERKRIEAQGISDAQKIVSQGLNPNILQLRTIEATDRLARSSNSKIIIMGGGKAGLPLLLPSDSAPTKPE